MYITTHAVGRYCYSRILSVHSQYSSGSHDYNVTEVICAAAAEHSLYEHICQMAYMGKIVVGGGCQNK